MLPGFVDFIVKKKAINMTNLCLFIKQADNIYTFLHIAFISILSGMSHQKQHMLKIAKNSGNEMTGQMKWVYRAMWFQAYLEMRSGESQGSCTCPPPVYYNFPLTATLRHTACFHFCWWNANNM